MGEKFRIKDIEDSREYVVSFINQTGLDPSAYLNSPKKIIVPFWSIVVASILVLITACSLFWVESPQWRGVCTLSLVVFCFLNISLIYMSWKNNILTGIVALGELILFVIALNIYTPKDVVDKNLTKRANDVISFRKNAPYAPVAEFALT